LSIRLEELVSIVQFVDQYRLGPTYRLLHEHQTRDQYGKVVGYRNLDRIGKSLQPIPVRRPKDRGPDQPPARHANAHRNWIQTPAARIFRHSTVLEPLQEGTLVRNAGAFGGNWSPIPDRTVMRDGQEVDIHTGTWTFTGKRGALVFRELTGWADLGQDLNRDAYVDDIAIGTWKVVRGTGTYAGITGGGRSAHLGLGRKWVARYEGFLTSP